MTHVRAVLNVLIIMSSSRSSLSKTIKKKEVPPCPSVPSLVLQSDKEEGRAGISG